MAGKYVKKKKDMNFQSVEALQQVVNVVNEAACAVNDKSRTISVRGKVILQPQGKEFFT